MKPGTCLLFFIKDKNLDAAVDEKGDDDEIDDNSYDNIIITDDKYHFLLPGMRWFCFMT